MPAFVSSPFGQRTSILPGAPAYSTGSQDTHNPDSRMAITSVAITSNVATVAVKLLEGPIPTVGSLISIQGTQTSAGAFNVTNSSITGVSINLSTGIGTVTFALTHADVATTADAGMALVPPPEVPEAISTGLTGLQFAMLSVTGLPNDSRDLMWEIDTPSAPASMSVALQVAMNDIDSEYTTIDTTTAAGSKQVFGVRANFIRIKWTTVTGGTLPTGIGKILV